MPPCAFAKPHIHLRYSSRHDSFHSTFWLSATKTPPTLKTSLFSNQHTILIVFHSRNIFNKFSFRINLSKSRKANQHLSAFSDNVLQISNSFLLFRPIFQFHILYAFEFLCIICYNCSIPFFQVLFRPEFQ